MTRFHRRRRSTGFTIVEAILVVAIVGIAMAVLIPAMGEMIRMTKMTGLTRETSMVLRKCRFEAIKRGVPCRVRLDTTLNELFAFADVHGAALGTPPDGVFAEIAGQPAGTTDYVVQRQRLPGGGIDFEFGGSTGLASVDGFSGATKDAVFQPNGSIDVPGAFRFSDPYGNSLEVRVTTTSARIEIFKWDGVNWLSQGEGGSTWKWH